MLLNEDIMKHIKTVSVAIAAYHGENFIAEQLRSLFHQTRTIDEIIISDDSEDNRTEQVVRQEAENWNGILKYIKNPQGKGIEANFRNAVKATSGDIIFLCDQDDVWLPEKVKTLADELETHPECQVVACNSEMVSDTLKPLGKTSPANLKTAQAVIDAINQKNAFPYISEQKLLIPGHAMAMTRKFVPFFLSMPAKMKYHDVWLEQTAALFETMRYVNKTLTLYRIHEANASTPLKDHGNSRIFLRLKEIFQKHDDIEETFFLFKSLKACIKTQCNYVVPERNIKHLNSILRFFQNRLHLRSFPRPFRFLALTPALLRDYFQLGTGWRALLRDQLF